MQLFSVRREWIFWLIVLEPLLLYGCLVSRLPAVIPSHYDLSGHPDTFITPLKLLLNIIPVGALFYGVLVTLPFLDTQRKSQFLFTRTYYYLRLLIQLLLSAVFSFMFLSAAGWEFNMIRMVGLVVMFILTLLGFYFRSASPGGLGFRTPWTLRDKRIWYRTHRAGGGFMSALGVVGFLLILALPVRTGGKLLLPIMVLAALFPVVYSFLLDKRQGITTRC